ncbi:MAG TPA: winged helix-turn-helix domain-containing protein, partial [Thermoanaerobaculia bacterium]|nr:winged helix-turn-helix domain-containing protein [Thermoanaerobaculia bacterium]
MTAIEPKTERVLYEFEDFRVDPVRRRLLRAGEPVPLTPKAFSILLVLLDKRGEVVEKEELIQKVWPDTYVTEANLTQNISSLRKALGERAQDSRLVLTIPGQGYSFVGEVFEVPRPMTGEIHLASLFTGLTETPPFGIPMPELPRTEPEPATATVSPAAADPPVPEVPASSEALVVAAPETPALPVLVERETAAAAVPVPLEPVPVTSLTAPVAQPVRTRRWLLGSGLLLLALAVAGTASYLYLYRERAGTRSAEEKAPAAETATPAANRRSIALLKLRNLSGRSQDSWLATAVPEMLLSELAIGSELRVITGDNVSRAQQSLRIKETDSLEPETLLKLHAVLGADLLVVGSYTYLESGDAGKIRIDLRVLEARGGDTVASVSEAGKSSELFDLVSRAGAQLRQRLGWGALSPAQAMATQALRPSSNDEAARLYFKGLDRLRTYDSLDALQHLKNAASLDSSSALIHSALVQAWSELGYDNQAEEEAEKAVQLAKSLPKEAQFAIQARYWTTKRNWDKAAEIYRSLWTFYPDDLDYGLQLAHSYSMGGRGAAAKTMIEDLRKLPPPQGDDPRIDLEEAELALRLSDSATQMTAAERAVAKGRKLGEIQVEARALSLKADALLMGGQPQQAMDLFQQAQHLFERAGNKPASLRLINHLGVALHEQGELASAQKMYDRALQGVERTGSAGGVALLKANLGLLYQDMGNVRHAEALLREACNNFETVGDPIRKTKSLYALATVLLSEGDVAGAGQRFNRVLAAARQTGNRLDEARALDGLGQILTRQGKLTAARQRQEKAFHLVYTLSNPSQSAVMLASSAE